MNQQKRMYLLIGGLVFSIVFFFLAIINKDSSSVDLNKGFQCGDNLVYGDYNYKTVKIGNQCWMAENLKTTAYRDGTSILNIPDRGEWSADKKGGYSCYHNDIKNCENHGALYNWYAVTNPSGLCPKGWSVPSHEKWSILEQSICNKLGHSNCEETFSISQSAMGWTGDDEGINLRTTSLNGKDAYGFAALFSGFRNSNGPFSFIQENGFWWTSTSTNEYAIGRAMDLKNTGIRRIESMKNSGFSVRCVMD